MTCDDFSLCSIYLGSNIMLTHHSERSWCTIQEYDLIFGALYTGKSKILHRTVSIYQKDRLFNGHKKNKHKNIKCQSSTQKPNDLATRIQITTQGSPEGLALPVPPVVPSILLINLESNI